MNKRIMGLFTPVIVGLGMYSGVYAMGQEYTPDIAEHASYILDKLTVDQQEPVSRKQLLCEDEAFERAVLYEERAVLDRMICLLHNHNAEITPGNAESIAINYNLELRDRKQLIDLKRNGKNKLTVCRGVRQRFDLQSDLIKEVINFLDLKDQAIFLSVCRDLHDIFAAQQHALDSKIHNAKRVEELD